MAKKYSVLINASNLHVGGGVQVAVSFIFELARELAGKNGDQQFSVYCSSVVDRNLRNLGVDFGVFCRYEVFDLHGLSSVFSPERKKFYGFDVCFTVFGPMYFDVRCGRHICGFAQPWIAYPDNPVYGWLGMRQKVLTVLKYFVQWRFFKRSDLLVVEQEHVRRALVSGKSVPMDFIEVVNNCFSSLYTDRTSWSEIDAALVPPATGKVRLGFLGRGYTHKNLAILLEVDRVLREQYRIECDFLFTLDAAEMEQMGFSQRKNFGTVGPILASQCPAFYGLIDGLIFPSLLECFSATPIEAMVMKKPVFASNLPFVTDACGAHAYYFDPLDAKDIAAVISDAFNDQELMRKKVEAAYAYSKSLPDAQDRASGYLDLISSKAA